MIKALNRPVDASGLSVLRIAFGALMVFAVIRFWAKGWIAEQYLEPSYFFSYTGFEWVKPWSGNGMYIHFATMGLAAALIALGWKTRIAAAAFFALFTYVELIDKTAYLNHYYLVSLISFLLIWLPTDNRFSLDAKRAKRPTEIPFYAVLALRIQIGLVYVHAGLAKLGSDWLLEGEPLKTWLQNHHNNWLLGHFFQWEHAALTMSWAGAFFDLSIVFWLLWRKSRPYAFAVLCGFHLVLGWLFPIGIFPWLMIICATVFFDPNWPKKWLKRGASHSAGRAKTVPPPLLLLLFAHLLLQTLIPLRHWLYPGHVNWTEEGFRFSWRVMLIEKNGMTEFKVVDEENKKSAYVFPRKELTEKQYKMMATQPDMIHQYALHLSAIWTEKGMKNPKVYALTQVSLNGRPRQALIDPKIDLASEKRTFKSAKWIQPLQQQSKEHR